MVFGFWFNNSVLNETSKNERPTAQNYKTNFEFFKKEPKDIFGVICSFLSC